MTKMKGVKMRRAQVTDLQGLFRLRSQNKKTTSFGAFPKSLADNLYYTKIVPTLLLHTA